MKIIFDGSDNEMECVRIESQNVPKNFFYQIRELFREDGVTSVFLGFGLMDGKEGAQK